MCSAVHSFANELTLGQKKADAACALCHGPIGIATLPNAPNLAGQQAIYLQEQLKNYRSGKRQNEVMGLIVNIEYLDNEIQIEYFLAPYFTKKNILLAFPSHF